MTAREMFYNFRLEVDKFNSNLPITSDDVRYYLNKAQDKFIETKFNGANYTRRGFQQSQQIIDELKSIYVKGEPLTITYPDIAIHANVRMDRGELPTDHRYFISSTCKIEYCEDPANIISSGDPLVRSFTAGTDTRTIDAMMKHVQSDDIYQLIRDPFNKPKLDKVLIDINEKYLDIYTDHRAVTKSVIINYIRNPLSINYEGDGEQSNQDCELPEFTHEDIIDLAVRLFVGQSDQQEQ